MPRVSTEECAACIGRDWADATHEICLQATGAAPRAFLCLDHRPDAIDVWVHSLRTRCTGQPMAVCLELQKGPIVSARRQEECLGLFPVNPLTVARYRDAFPPRRAKDAPTDAALQVAMRLQHRDTLTPLTPPSPARRALAQRVEHRRRLVGDHVRLPTRLPRALHNSFPHVLQWFQEQDPAIFCAFLSRWPTRNAAQLARRTTLEGFFRAHPVRSADVLTPRIEARKRARALTTDDGVIPPHGLLGQALVAPLRVPVPAITDFDNAITQRAQDPPDCPLVDAWPGAGAVFAPRRLVALGAQRERAASAAALQKYAGIAPVTDRRGKQSWLHGRLPCPTFLRQTCVAWAAESIRHACWAHVYDQQQRDKGQAHQAAVRALAFKWLRLLDRCWQDRTPYDASTSLQALHRRGSSLIQHLAKAS